MQPSRILFLAGVVTAGAIGLAGLAYAGDSGLKTLSLQLPGGQVAQIEYNGPTQPVPVGFPMALATPIAIASPPGNNPFGTPDPTAQLYRFQAMMDQQTAIMIQALQVITAPHLTGAGAIALSPAALIGPAAGSSGASYSFVFISGSASGTCMHSIQMTSGAQGQAPQVLQQSAGSCGGAKLGVPAAGRALPAVKLLRAGDVHPVAVPQASPT